MKILGASLLAFVALGCWCGAALADVQMVNCSTASSPTELDEDIVCPQFNLGGTLQSVQIDVSGTIMGQLSLSNSGFISQTGAGTTSSSFSVGALAGFTFVNPLFEPSFTTGPRTLTATETLTVAGLSDSGDADLGTNSSSLGPYTGAGSFDIAISTVTSSGIEGGGGSFGGGGFTSASATAVVTYTYAP